MIVKVYFKSETCFELTGLWTLQGLIVQRMYNVIYPINHHSVDSMVGFVNTYPWIMIYLVDSVIHPSNNWGQGHIAGLPPIPRDSNDKDGGHVGGTNNRS